MSIRSWTVQGVSDPATIAQAGSTVNAIESVRVPVRAGLGRLSDADLRAGLDSGTAGPLPVIRHAGVP
jgi:hypothetical protein